MNAAPRCGSRLARIVAGSLLAASAALPGCGTCVLVVTRDFDLPTTAGETVPVRVTFRPEGIAEQPGLRNLLASPIYEVMDVVLWPVAVVRCLVDEHESVAGGPIGCITAITPFATLVPGPYSLLPSSLPVDAPTLAVLRGPDTPARRDAIRSTFPAHDVHTLSFR